MYSLNFTKLNSLVYILPSLNFENFYIRFKLIILAITKVTYISNDYRESRIGLTLKRTFLMHYIYKAAPLLRINNIHINTITLIYIHKYTFLLFFLYSSVVLLTQKISMVQNLMDSPKVFKISMASLN